MNAVNENLVDIVIPTMWRSQELLATLFTYVNCAEVGRVILIDNDPQKRPQIPQPTLERLVIISHEKNIYVNPAWNEGVSQCTSKFICLANDDIVIDEALFKVILSLDWDVHEIDIIGLGTLAKQGETEIRKAEINKNIPLGTQIPTFGACMFMPRCKYSPIPKELRVWYGDDYLVHNMTNIYILISPLVTGNMSATIRSFEPHSDIHSTIKEDIAWARKNLLTIAEDRTITEASSPNRTNIPDSHTVSLDLGCGNKPRNPFKATKVIGIDPQCPSSDILACWVGFEEIPLEDASVDFVTAFDFIEHLPRFAMKEKPFNPFINAMNEIWRVLRANGIFFARTPAYPSAAAFQDPTHVNIITDQTVSYFARRPCLDGSLIDPWGLPLGKRYGFTGEFLLIKQWWDTTHLCWHMTALK